MDQQTKHIPQSDQQMDLRYMLNIPDVHYDLVGIVFSKREILKMLQNVQLVLPNSNMLAELVMELKDMEGVAHTSGPHGKKKITLSSKYFMKVEKDHVVKEYLGVLCHELVHTIQYNGMGTADGGVIEGIADYGMQIISQ
jgi:hypothetical protein